MHLDTVLVGRRGCTAAGDLTRKPKLTSRSARPIHVFYKDRVKRHPHQTAPNRTKIRIFWRLGSLGVIPVPIQMKDFLPLRPPRHPTGSGWKPFATFVSAAGRQARGRGPRSARSRPPDKAGSGNGRRSAAVPTTINTARGDARPTPGRTEAESVAHPPVIRERKSKTHQR